MDEYVTCQIDPGKELETLERMMRGAAMLDHALLYYKDIHYRNTGKWPTGNQLRKYIPEVLAQDGPRPWNPGMNTCSPDIEMLPNFLQRTIAQNIGVDIHQWWVFYRRNGFPPKLRRPRDPFDTTLYFYPARMQSGRLQFRQKILDGDRLRFLEPFECRLDGRELSKLRTREIELGSIAVWVAQKYSVPHWYTRIHTAPSGKDTSSHQPEDDCESEVTQ